MRAARRRILATSHPGVRATRWGIAFALGAATIAFPVVSVDGVVRPSGVANAASVAGMARASAVLPAVAFVAIESDPAPAGQVPPEAISAGDAPLDAEQLAVVRARAEQAGANQARAVLPDCTGKVIDPNAENGRLNVADLCELTWANDQDGMLGARKLRADAAVALARLNAAYYTEFGTDLCVGDTYRNYEEQAAAKARKPRLAAPAGVSNHGWALAADLCGGIAQDNTPQWQWMNANAQAFGWDNPEWARTGGRGPHEPWHWEYVDAVKEKRAANQQAYAALRNG